MNRVTAINKSMRVFFCGLLGFLPLIGLIPGILALYWYAQVEANYGEWNPGGGYMRAGAILALLGVMGSLLVLAAGWVACCT